SRIRVIVKDMGGGFGNYKYHPEDVITSLMSVKTGRPVKWVASRRELLLAGYHSREQTHFVKAGFSRDGRIKGLQDRIFADMGAYLTREATGPAVVTSHMLPGPYDIRNISIELFCVATNKSYSSAYRGFGQPEAAFVMERLMDLAAAELDVDPSEVRLRNFVQPEQMPYRSPTGVVHDNANFSDCLKHALKLMDYVNLKHVYRSQPNRCLGLGVAFYVELTGFGPARVAGITGAVHGGYESMTLRFDVSGQATIFTGLVPHGQGSETTLSQVAAELLGLDFEDVRIVYGDTDITPYGLGTFGSRNAVVGSGAVYKLADALIKKAVKVAANILEAKEDDIEFKDGFFYVKGVPGKRLHIKEIAKRAILAVGLPSDVEPGFEASVSYDPGSWTNTWGVHVALVEVDPETGKVDILKYVIVDDSGTLINPMIVEGQVVGGAVQGIGGTLLEELSYDSDGHLISSTFMDYLIPSAADCPPFLIEHMETKAKTNPLGVKGVGESGIIPTSAALANAVEDALRNYGVKVRETPLTAYKIHSLIKKSG
ncbi:MAG: molybdopterin-dependent oxidoreductase, partial [Candidatus Caldarchaeum sp.]|nr:molybdopterin-dependent oxidoreductase [Candidatus Caldarchaeum sp.]